MKAILLSNINMQPLVRALRQWDVSVGTYNSMLADLSTAESPACAADVTHVLCLYDSDTLMGEAFYGSAPAGQCEMFLQALDGFCARHTDKVVVANLLSFSSNRWLGFADVMHADSLRARQAELNTKLVAIAKLRPNLLLLDLDPLIRRHGEDALFSNAFWYTARIRYSARMFELLAETIRQAINAHAQHSKKVLILDLDDTLWGGIVGETGPLGVALSEEGKGLCYRNFQRCIKATTRTGVLLAIASKNNQADVIEVFDQNKMMVLRREDFAAMCINWSPKVQNIVDIANELNLGTDSFVFIDDNPVERDAVRTALPDVTVPDFPARAEELANWFTQKIVPEYFGKYAISDEDGAKTEQYRANKARQQLAASFDLDSYLAQLGIECSISVNNGDRLVRAAQMTQKTSQFNLTTRRYEVTDLARFVRSHEHAVLMLDYKDRFGDEGAVALAIVDLAEGRIDTFLESCRVIGRRVEDRLLDRAIELCRSHGHRRIIGEYVPTRKNRMVAQFYDSHGFEPMSRHDDGRITYQKAIDDCPAEARHDSSRKDSGSRQLHREHAGHPGG
jgi:FkbH-like protein